MGLQARRLKGLPPSYYTDLALFGDDCDVLHPMRHAGRDWL
jgi:hypothetical protein